MDLQTAKALSSTRVGWAKLSAFLLFAIAGALLVSSLTESRGWHRSDTRTLVAQG